MPKKVLLGMSGGVDSSVSAVLLLEAGYEVIGGFMKNWSENDGGEECVWRRERRDAMRVAGQLGLKFYTFDFEKEYRQRVYEYMIDEYKAGRTPNPDVLCNKYMKFDLFLKEADALGCDFIATGHYARRIDDKDGIAHLYTGVDTNKDQSYFLCQLNQVQIKRSLFPVGNLEKPEVRRIAREHDLFVADKKDSQGICFVGQIDMRQFLEARIAPHSGNIVTTDGRVLGQHQGFEFYTIGQRGGLGVGGGTPLYVVDRKKDTNEVVVALGPDDPALFRSELVAIHISETFPGAIDRVSGKKIAARIRYRQPLAECEFHRDGEEILVHFSVPQRAMAPGQFAAFYDGEELIGSGVIS
ncbi:MAG: tRNA 2-thiouridine(34) synthase MnmA [Patescibacteria group bacterium]|jgi:tRNA-specific 2-thiouridylase